MAKKKKKKSAFDKLTPKPQPQPQNLTVAQNIQALKQFLPLDIPFLEMLMEVQLTENPSNNQISRWLNCPEQNVRLQAIGRSDIKFTAAHIEQILKDTNRVKGALGKEHAHQLPANVLEKLLTDSSSEVRYGTLLNDNFKLTKFQFDRLIKEAEAEEGEPRLIAAVLCHTPEHLSESQIESILCGSSLINKVALVKVPHFTPTVEQIRAELEGGCTNNPIPNEGIDPQAYQLLKGEYQKFWESKRYILERTDLKENTSKKIGRLNDPRLDGVL